MAASRAITSALKAGVRRGWGLPADRGARTYRGLAVGERGHLRTTTPHDDRYGTNLIRSRSSSNTGCGQPSTLDRGRSGGVVRASGTGPGVDRRVCHDRPTFASCPASGGGLRVASGEQQTSGGLRRELRFWEAIALSILRRAPSNHGLHERRMLLIALAGADRLARRDSRVRALALGFEGISSFAGFEGAASLGEETADPRRNIPRAIGTDGLVAGGFYIVVIVAQTWGSETDAAVRRGVSAPRRSPRPRLRDRRGGRQGVRRLVLAARRPVEELRRLRARGRHQLRCDGQRLRERPGDFDGRIAHPVRPRARRVRLGAARPGLRPDRRAGGRAARRHDDRDDRDDRPARRRHERRERVPVPGDDRRAEPAGRLHRHERRGHPVPVRAGPARAAVADRDPARRDRVPGLHDLQEHQGRDVPLRPLPDRRRDLAARRTRDRGRASRASRAASARVSHARRGSPTRRRRPPTTAP